MKKYNIIVPEVIVGLGDSTQFDDPESATKEVIRLHIELEDWLGDDIMINSGCCIVTETLKKALEKSIYSGFFFVDMKVTKNYYFGNNYQQEKPLPIFYWMKINGIKDKDDIYYNNGLYITDIFLTYLKENFSLQYVQLNPQKNEFDLLLESMIKESKGKSN